MWYIWLIAAGVFFIAEIATVGFMIFWLGIAALITCVVSLFTSNLVIQMAVFVILSAILLLFTRPLINKFVNKKEPELLTNAFSIIGKEATVVKSFDEVSKLGQIQVGSETWTAVSKDDELLKEGDIVKVEDIDGVKAVVTRL